MFKIIIGNINDPLLPRILFFFGRGEVNLHWNEL